MPSVVAATELCKNQFDSDWKLGKEELLEVISTRDGGAGRTSGQRPVISAQWTKPPHTLCKAARIDGWLGPRVRPGVSFFRGRWKNAAERVMNAYARCCCVHLWCIRFHVSPLTWDAPQKKTLRSPLFLRPMRKKLKLLSEREREIVHNE